MIAIKESSMFDPFSISVLQLVLPLNSPPSTIVTWRRCNILLTLFLHGLTFHWFDFLIWKRLLFSATGHKMLRLFHEVITFKWHVHDFGVTLRSTNGSIFVSCDSSCISRFVTDLVTGSLTHGATLGTYQQLCGCSIFFKYLTGVKVLFTAVGRGSTFFQSLIKR